MSSAVKQLLSSKPSMGIIRRVSMLCDEERRLVAVAALLCVMVETEEEVEGVAEELAELMSALREAGLLQRVRDVVRKHDGLLADIAKERCLPTWGWIVVPNALRRDLDTAAKAKLLDALLGPWCRPPSLLVRLIDRYAAGVQ